MQRYLYISLLLIAWLTACAGPAGGTPARVLWETTPSPSLPPTAPQLVPSPTISPTQTATITPFPSPTNTHSPTPGPTLVPSLVPGDAERLPPVRVSLIAHGSRERPWVALTFDLCQDPKYPSGFDRKIYQALVDAQAPATFFFGGDWARTHVDQARLLLANPLFEAGNHSWSHPDFTTIDEGEIRSQVIMTQNILHRLSGRQPTLFRLPAGKYNDLALETIASLGLYTIQWDADSGDPDPTITADEMVALIKTRVQNGSIILMHANGRGWNTAEALPGMIAYLRGAGYKLVTVSELLAAP